MTTNGYDDRWIEAINGALADRGSPVRVTDLDDGLWERHLGPLIDELEEMTFYLTRDNLTLCAMCVRSDDDQPEVAVTLAPNARCDRCGVAA